MTRYLQKFNLKVDEKLNNFLINDVLPGLQVTEEVFWESFSKTMARLGPKNQEILRTRKDLQNQIDSWHINNRSVPYNLKAFKEFLIRINYIVPEGDDFLVNTENVDPEIALISGPQLVVPITNARYALNAVNARWGSLYDALYGTDIIEGQVQSITYSRERGKKVVTLSKEYLDEFFGLNGLKWQDITNIESVRQSLIDSNQYLGKINNGILLRNNNLLVKIKVNNNDTIGADDPAGICDVLFESAISVIMDCEDSVATVDVDDKILAYKNWLGLMKGDLIETFQKAGNEFLRSINDDEFYDDHDAGDWDDAEAYNASVSNVVKDSKK